MPNVSICISAQDNFSSALRTMAQAVTPLRRDLGQLQTELNTLNQTRASLRVDMTQARKEVNDARRAFETLQTEESRAAYETAQLKYDNLSSQLHLASQNIRQTERDMRNLANAQNTVRESAERTESALQSTLQETESTTDVAPSMLAAMAKIGFAKMAGDTLSNAANAFVSSAVGSNLGGILAGAAGGAVSGAAMGSAVAPGIGTAVGAAVGAALGGIQSAVQVWSSQDDAFKTYVQEAVENQNQQEQAMISNGSGIAAQRETDKISFTTLFGDADTANAYLEQVRILANSTPFQYDDLTSMSKTLKTFGFGVEQMIPTLKAVGDAGAALGMDVSNMNTVATAIGRMKASDKGSLEYLNMLTERGIDVIGYIAQDKGVSKGDVYGMVSKGQIGGEYASNLILQRMNQDYGGAMEQQSHTYAGLVSTKEGLEGELDNAAGEGYNIERKSGIERTIKMLNSDFGTAMQNANREIGAFQASLDNLQESLRLDMQAAVMNVGGIDGAWSKEAQERIQTLKEEYANVNADSKNAAAERGRILKETEVLAQSEYNASEGAQLMKQSELSLIANVRNDTAIQNEYWNTGYTLGQAFDKGRAAATANSVWATIGASGVPEGADSGYYPDLTSSTAQSQKNQKGYASVSSANSQTKKVSGSTTSLSHNIYQEGAARRSTAAKKAFGMQTVPYNDFPALLHEGERVLTASQTRALDQNNNLAALLPQRVPAVQQTFPQTENGGVVVHMGDVTVRQESDITAIAQAFLQQYRIAKAAAAPR